jgi:hypothetical protein
MAARRKKKGGRSSKRAGAPNGKRRGAVLLVILLAAVIGYALLASRPDEVPALAATAYHDEIGSGICASIYNSHECAAAIESVVLPELPNRARRGGDTLVLRLAAGDSVVLVDPRREDAFDDPSYHLVGVMRTGHFVVHGQYYEGDFYLVVNERTGEEHRLWARPIVSPDGERIMAASADVAAGYNENGFQIWRVRRGRLALEWSIQPEVWGPLDAEWIDALSIRFIKEGWCEDGTGFCRTPAVLELREEQWRVRDTGPAERVTS